MAVTEVQRATDKGRIPDLGNLRRQVELKGVKEAAKSRLRSDLGKYLQALEMGDVRFVISPVGETAILIDRRKPRDVIELLENATTVAAVSKIMDQIAHAFLSKLNVWEKITCTFADGPSVDYYSPTHQERIDEGEITYERCIPDIKHFLDEATELQRT